MQASEQSVHASSDSNANQFNIESFLNSENEGKQNLNQSTEANEESSHSETSERATPIAEEPAANHQDSRSESPAETPDPNPIPDDWVNRSPNVTNLLKRRESRGTVSPIKSPAGAFTPTPVDR